MIHRVGKDWSNDLSVSPSTNVIDRGGLVVDSCLIVISNGENNIPHWPQISYCEADNRGLTKADIIHQLVMNL